MMMTSNDQPKQYLTCETCHGAGRDATGICSDCDGHGVSLVYQGKIFYWNLKLGQALIGLGYLRKQLNNTVNLIAFLLGLSGVAAFVWWNLEEGQKFFEPSALIFWQQKHWLLLVFWVGMAAFMFIHYRLSEDRALKQRITKLDFNHDKQWFDPLVGMQGLKNFKKLEKIDVAYGYSFRAIEALENAYLLAKKLKHEQVLPLHLFLAALADSEVRVIFSRLYVNESKLVNKIKNQLGLIPQSKKPLALSEELRKALIEAYLQANDLGQVRVKPLNLILPAVANDKVLAEILYDFEIDLDKLNNTVFWFRVNERQWENYKIYKRMARFKPSTAMDKAYTAVATPVLNAFSYDLTLAAKWMRLEFCVAREKELDEIFRSLEAGHNGVILVGEVGVGKKTIIHGLAQLMVKEEVPKMLQDKRLLELDISRLVSGASPSEAQERLLTILDEIARAGNIALFINNIETIVGITAGKEESSDLADVLVTALEHHGLFCFTAVTRENYLRYIEGQPLGNNLAKIEIEEPAGNQAINIIESKIGFLEAAYKVYFTYSAIEEAVKLTSKYIHDKFLPAKAIELLDSLAVKAGKGQAHDNIITKDDVAVALSEATGIPVSKVSEDEGKELLNLEERIHEHMINQVEAVDMVAASLRRARAQLSEGKRPIASFLFLGPTGVGKTELAKTVAKVYFGDEKCMIRLDMSEYQNQSAISKMIGDSGSKGYLTEAVRQAPFSLLLLDEFEKAHPEILNLFLQVMDDGRLTDGQGHTIDFTNCIIIATSNAGALFIQEQIRLGIETEKIKEVLINEHLNKIMRPELINRFDGLIVFKPLTEEHVAQIAKLMLNKTAKALEEKGIRLVCDPNGINILAQAGFDPKFGARPLRRLLQDRVDNIVANKILAGELKRRDTVIIDAAGEVQVEKAKEL